MTNKDVQPFIKTTTKNAIYKISYITGRSVKQICKDLCLHTLQNREKLTKELSPFIKWGMKIENNVLSPTDKPIRNYPLSGDNLERVTIKIDLNSYEFARGLAFSLGWSVAKVIAYCIERSIGDFDFVNQYISDYIEVSMGEEQKERINEIMKYVNEVFDEEYSTSSLLIGIVDELKPTDKKLDEVMQQLVMKW